MKQTLQKPIVAALVLLLISLPPSLAAREKRGAELVITKKAGQLVRGELIAVRPDSIVVFVSEGKDESVDIAEISTIKIVRKSKALKGLLYGFASGAVTGVALTALPPNLDEYALNYLFSGLFLGAVGGAVGLAVGAGLGSDQVIAFAGLPAKEKDRILAKMNRLARIPGTHIPRQVMPETGEMATKPPPSGHGWTRFKLTWMPGLRLRRNWYPIEIEGEEVAFRFTEDLPPEEAGPFSSSWYSAENMPRIFTLGRVTLAYQWTRRFAAEIEFNVSSYVTEYLADLRFTSALDGLEYQGIFGSDEVISWTALSLGLSFRPFPPAPLQHHVIEVGVAAGPAWTRTAIADEGRTNVARATTWTARGLVSYDYHFSPAFSVGIFAERQWLRLDVPSYGVTGLMDFWATGEGDDQILLRMTEVALPARTLALGGFSCGLRFGFGL